MALGKRFFIPACTVVVAKGSDQHLLCCGLVGGLAHIAWELRRATAPNGETTFAPRTDADASFQYLFLLDWEDYDVVPTEVVSPARAFCRQGYKLSPHLGIALRKSGEKLSALEHAANSAFWRLGGDVLLRACEDKKAAHASTSEYDLVEALIREAIKDIIAERLAALMDLWNAKPVNYVPVELTDEILADLASKDEIQEFKDFLLGTPAFFTHCCSTLPFAILCVPGSRCNVFGVSFVRTS